jgi:hypothetical protein
MAPHRTLVGVVVALVAATAAAVPSDISRDRVPVVAVAMGGPAGAVSEVHPVRAPRIVVTRLPSQDSGQGTSGTAPGRNAGLGGMLASLSVLIGWVAARRR